MGSAIAARLLGLGHQVTVFNRSRARAEPLLAIGAAWAETAAQLAQKTDIMVSLLTNEQALDDVYLSDHGLLSGDVAGKLFIEMSTVSPAKHQALALQVQAVKASYLECPVSGSVGPAKEGKLIGFVGGEAKDLARALPYLESVCRLVEHVGPFGSGATMKLAVNLPLMVYWQTLGESLSLVEPLGIDPARMIDILSDSSGGPNMLKVRGAMIAQTLQNKKSEQVTVSVSTMRKDMRAMLDQAQATQRNLPLTALALEKFNAAAESGLDEKDCTELPVWWLEKGR
jgi:3-hydroxyisobutyrate dehydrogenase